MKITGIALILALGLLSLGCRSEKEAEPESLPQIPSAPTEPLAQDKPAEVPQAGLRPSLLKPVSGVVLPEGSRMLRNSPSLTLYQVDADLVAVEAYLKAQGLAPTRLDQTRGLNLICEDGTDLRIFSHQERSSRFLFMPVSRPDSGPEAAKQASDLPIRQQAGSQEQVEQVKEAVRQGNRNIRELLGPDFQD